jgi:copper chaperone NosL
MAITGGVGCVTPAPRDLVLGADVCTHCHMTFVDPRFGAELVTTTGKIYAFDDAGCLASHLIDPVEPAERWHSLWVMDYLRPDALIPADQAIFLRSDLLRTPMDHRFVAVTAGPSADSLQTALGAERLDWAAVRERIRARAGP